MSSTSASASAVIEALFDLTGQQVGAYQLERVLGEGAMGTVYLGRQGRIGRAAAVKVLRPEHAQDPDLVRRFIHEAQAVNAIKNEHIVEVYDFGEQMGPDGVPLVFCVMELLEGAALADIMLATPYSVRGSVHIVQQLAIALQAAHHVGVVHRDIKPENLFVTQKEGQVFVKVLDFGVAKLFKPIGDVPISQTQAGTVIGTPEYMAPEQALGHGTDVRVDVYAMGLVLYELLTGQRPFTGNTFGKLVVELTQKSPPALPPRSMAGDEIPPGLEAVMRRCLEKQPQARYQTAAEVGLALEPFSQAVFPAQVAAEPAAPPIVDDPTSPFLMQPRRSRGTLVMAGLTAVAVASGVTWFLLPAALAMQPISPVVALPPTVIPPSLPAVSPLDTLLVTSTPSGAEVRNQATKQVLGITPLRLTLSAAERLPLELVLAGHEVVQREVAVTGAVTLAVDLPVAVKKRRP